MQKGIYKKRILLCLFFLFISISVFSEDKNFVNWKLSFVLEDETEADTNDLSHILKLPSGTEYSLLIESEEDAECYVVLEQSDKKELVLYKGPITAGKQIYLPQENFGSEVFKINSDSGVEKIHIVVSRNSQTDLEKLLKNNTSNIINKNFSDKVIDEISSLKQNASSYTEQPVKPAVTGGTTRQFSAKRVRPYTEFNGADLYVKTIRISH